MRIRLTNKGINVDEILNEIEDYENQDTTIEVGSVVQLNDVTIIPFENVYIQNNEQAFLELVPSDEPSSLHENVLSESNSANDNQLEINFESISNSTAHDCFQENVASECNSLGNSINDKRHEVNLESISNFSTDDCIEKNSTESNSNNDNRHEIKLGPISKPSIHDCLQENLSSESNSIKDNRYKINFESISFLNNNQPVSSNTSPFLPLAQKINDDIEFVEQNCVQTSRLHKNIVSCDLEQSTIPSTENDSELNKSLENLPANIDINVQPFKNSVSNEKNQLEDVIIESIDDDSKKKSISTPFSIIKNDTVFERHLHYPQPTKKSNKRPSKKLPSAISSSEWRAYYNRKEDIKKRKN